VLSFVLSRKDFKENDQLLVFYTLEKGKIEAVARGIKKIISKNSAYLTPIFLLDADFLSSKEMFLLRKATPVECYKNIFSDSSKMSALNVVFKWLNSLIDVGQQDKKIFYLVRQWVDFLNLSGKINRGFVFGFLGCLIAQLGFAPVFENCSVCGVKNNLVGFYPTGGGVICRACLLVKKQKEHSAYLLRSSDMVSLKLLFTGQWDEILARNTEVANRLLFLYAQYHCERKLAKLTSF
jgi:DNA repair protein RecO (recombination protein O)